MQGGPINDITQVFEMKAFSKILFIVLSQKHQINISFQRFPTSSLVFQTVSGDSSRRCLTVSMLMTVYIDLGLSLFPLFALFICPVFLNLCRRSLIVSLLGGVFSEKLIVNYRYMTVTNFDSKYASTVYCFRSIGVKIDCFVVDIPENEKRNLCYFENCKHLK